MQPRRKQQLKYITADFFSAVLTWLSFLLFRWLVYEGKVFGVDTILIPAFSFWMPLILFPLGCVSIYFLSGYYLRPYHKRYGKEFRTTFTCSVLISMGTFFITIIDDHVTQYQYYLWSLLVLFTLHFLLTYLPRLLITIFSNRNHEEEPHILIEQKEGMDDNALYHAISKAFLSGKEIYIIPRLYDILTGAAQINALNQTPYVCITKQHMSDAGICIKHTLDILFSLLAIILLSPAFLVIALLIKATSPGPVLYKQERIGLYGRPFMILKFRTMYNHAEQGVPKLTASNDERITPLGSFLRRYRLDELPQFINILKGDMSIVGPRPERQFFINQIIEQAPYYCLLYKIRPGLTSWGPIKVGYTDTTDKMIERLKYDIAYMENMSIELDMKILFYTIGVIIDGKGQ